MHGGARSGAGCPPQNKSTTDTVLSHPQLFSGPSLSVPGVPGSSKIIHPLFCGNNNDSQVSLILDASSVATAIADVFQKNAISMGNKFMKMSKIFDKIDEIKKMTLIHPIYK